MCPVEEKGSECAEIVKLLLSQFSLLERKVNISVQQRKRKADIRFSSIYIDQHYKIPCSLASKIEKHGFCSPL